MSEQSTATRQPEQDEPTSRLTVIRRGQRPGYVLYRCACGTEKEIRCSHVRGGKILSCGCLGREMAAARCRTHGKTGTVEYRTWKNILRRCHNPTAADFPRYGGRGIAVCQRWRESFKAFLADMGPRPGPRHSIDRIDNNGHYEPGNCRWATAKEQSRNKRNNVIIELDGVRRTVAEWAESTKLSANTIHFRVRVCGWDAKRALTEPVGRWARALCDACLNCGTTARKHHAKGYCRRCYEAVARKGLSKDGS